MSGNPKIIYINRYRWRDVTDETTAGRVYRLRRVLDIGGDPRRLHEIQNTDSSND